MRVVGLVTQRLRVQAPRSLCKAFRDRERDEYQTEVEAMTGVQRQQQKTAQSVKLGFVTTVIW